jgi:hypothetical protein
MEMSGEITRKIWIFLWKGESIDAHGTNTNDISQEVIFFTAKFQQLLSKWELVVVISFLVLDDSWPRIT